MLAQRKLSASVLVFLTCLVLAGAVRAGEPTPEAIAKWVANFGSTDFQERSKAYRQLVLAGPPALPVLREAMKSEDLEVSRRASNCAAEIERLAPGISGEGKEGTRPERIGFARGAPILPGRTPIPAALGDESSQ